MEETIVVKIGGVASDNLTPAFFEQIKTWQAVGKKVIIVHGGGHYISEMMATLKIPVEIQNGLRVTTAETLDITRMVLLGKVQPMITTAFQQAGLTTIGLNAGCDQLIEGTIINQEKLGFVGKVKEVNQNLLQLLTNKKHVPVIAPLGITTSGQWLNINADEVACQIAIGVKATQLFLLTDVPGIKKENQWLKEISTGECTQLRAEKVVTGGMIPKIESARQAVLNGVACVHINNVIHTSGTAIYA